MTIDAKQRLAAVSAGQTVDRPPCICPGGMMNMIFEDAMDACGCYWPEAHSDGAQMAALAMALGDKQGFENFGVPFCMTVEAESLGAVANMGTRFIEPHVVESPFVSSCGNDLPDEYDYSSGRIKTVLDAIAIMKEQGKGYPIIGNITGPCSLAGTLVDMSVLLKEFRKKPESAHAFMEQLARLQGKLANKMIEAGADAICLSEPSGTGEILGPRRFEEYSVRYINMVMDALPDVTKIVHICGDLSGVYKELSGLHCNVFSFDSLVSVTAIKPYLEGKAVMGNVSTHTIGTADEAKVAAMAKAALDHGADVLAPACGLPTTTPLRNVQAMVRAAMEHVRE